MSPRLFVAPRPEDEHVLAAVRRGYETRQAIQDISSRWLRWRTFHGRRIAIMRALHRLEARGQIYRTTPTGTPTLTKTDPPLLAKTDPVD